MTEVSRETVKETCSDAYFMQPLKKELPEISERDLMLAQMIAAHGISSIRSKVGVVKENLMTQHSVKTGKPTDQKSSGRCWIFGSLNMLRIPLLEKYGEDFEYSQNFCAFWDKRERANFFLEKMIQYVEKAPEGFVLTNMLDNLYGDGGEWEMFCNVVKKYGLVPKSAMPETEFSGNSGGYMRLIRQRLLEYGGVIHSKGQQGASVDELQEVKQSALDEITKILVAYLGKPPEEFQVKVKGGEGEKDRLESMTPLEFAKENPIELDDMVHLVHLPYRPMHERLQVEDVGNVVEGKPIEGFNVSMQVIKDAVRRSILDGQSVPCAAEVRSLDKARKLFSIENDRLSQVFEMDERYRLNKGDRLRYRSTVVAHLMSFTGCDDASVEKEGAPIQELQEPLWKVENSWKDCEEIFMTDRWVDEYLYGVIVDKKYLDEATQAALKGVESAEPLKVPASDPFGRI